MCNIYAHGCFHHHNHLHQVPSSSRMWAVMILHCSRSPASLTRSSYLIPVNKLLFVIHCVLGLPLVIVPSSGPSNISPQILVPLIIIKPKCGILFSLLLDLCKCVHLPRLVVLYLFSFLSSRLFSSSSNMSPVQAIAIFPYFW